MHVKENSTYRQINIRGFLVILLCHQSFPVWRQKWVFKIPQNSLRNFRAKSRASTYPWVPHNEDRSVRCTATSAHPAIDENCGDPAPIPWRGLWQGSSAWKINPTSFLPLIIFWQKNCHITVAFIHSYERQGITRCRSPVQMESHHEHASHAAGAEPRGPPSPVSSRPILGQSPKTSYTQKPTAPMGNGTRELREEVNPSTFLQLSVQQLYNRPWEFCVPHNTGNLSSVLILPFLNAET